MLCGLPTAAETVSVLTSFCWVAHDIKAVVWTPKPSETNMGLCSIKIKVTWLGIIPNGLFLVFDCFGH